MVMLRSDAAIRAAIQTSSARLNRLIIIMGKVITETAELTRDQLPERIRILVACNMFNEIKETSMLTIKIRELPSLSSKLVKNRDGKDKRAVSGDLIRHELDICSKIQAVSSNRISHLIRIDGF